MGDYFDWADNKALVMMNQHMPGKSETAEGKAMRKAMAAELRSLYMSAHQRGQRGLE